MLPFAFGDKNLKLLEGFILAFQQIYLLVSREIIDKGDPVFIAIDGLW